ncbi:hypothetical protein Q4491_18775 [Photobacterium sp. 2_MG-2023]|uniref:hypothetical protein n=1 Tax=Photobacterium sp. 2_MG-2023 TaxID=3062663 RepID=UPI0026E283A5|nr:hypothetical protein [Photobacterium sp. 2_MG-2023]MDO6583389.1 hypothetical protein [Photobacterium sp. 2_MG-2023]
MDISQFFEYVGKAVSLSAALFGLYCVVLKWRKREEHFPRINFGIDAEVIDTVDGMVILNVVASLENKGVVPLKIKEFICELRGISHEDKIELGGGSIRHQLNFKNDLGSGAFFPLNWDFSFVYPSVTTQYTYITIIPADTKYLLVKGRFHYMSKNESHHAGKVINVSRLTKAEP